MTPIKDIECYLLDMDGTLYLGMDPIPGAKEFLDELKARGKKVFYITNNSARTANEYVEKLKKVLDVEATEDQFFTSADAMAYYLDKMDAGKRIYLIGTPAFERYLERRGYTIVHEFYEADEHPELRPDFVLLGFDTTMTYEKLRIACDYLREGVRYIATHPDMVCPAEKGRSVPDAGSFMLLIEGATGRTPELVAGKPNPTMVNILHEITGIPKDKMAVVGDRLNTDIMAGVNAGINTICVLTGEATREQAAAVENKPDYLLDSVNDITLAIRA